MQDWKAGDLFIFKSKSKSGPRGFLDDHGKPVCSADKAQKWEVDIKGDVCSCRRVATTASRPNVCNVKPLMLPNNGRWVLYTERASYPPTAYNAKSGYLRPGAPMQKESGYLATDKNGEVKIVTDPTDTDAHWKPKLIPQPPTIRREYRASDIKEIVKRYYPKLQINSNFTDGEYVSMSYDEMKRIWDSSSLSRHEWREQKFDCDDFAICFKAKLAKRSYNNAYKRPFMCGVMFGRKPDGSKHAFNFTVNDKGELILFEPQNGSVIPHTEWAPYFYLL